MRRNMRTGGGFTLIELIIVCIIIGILASIAAPMMAGIQARAIAAEAATGLGTLRTAIRNYYIEYPNFPVESNYVYGTGGAMWIIDNPGLMSALGLKANDFQGVYFGKECYSIYIRANWAQPILYCWPRTWALGRPDNTAPKAPELDNITDSTSAYIVMHMRSGRIKQSAFSKSGFRDGDASVDNDN